MTLIPVNVTVRVARANTLPWKKGKVKFYLLTGSYTNTHQIPGTESATITSTLDDNGEDIVTLWAEDTGIIETSYLCILPNGESFTFNIPVPGLTSYELSVLRQLGQTIQNPNYSTVIDYINNYLESGVISSGGSNITFLTYTQSVASNNWVFNHNKNKIPIAQVTDLNGVIKPLVEIKLTLTQVIVNSILPIVGKVNLFFKD